MKRATKRKFNNYLYIILFCALPILHLILFTIVPFIVNVINSFYSMSYTQNNGFVGVDNYKDIFCTPEFWESLKVSLYYIASAILQTFIAFFLALILVKQKKFYNFFKGCIFLPYLINSIAIGFIFRLFFTRGFIFDSLLSGIGVDINNLPFWLRDKPINNIVLAFVSLWRYTGFNMILFIGGLISIDKNLYDVAKVDGASKFDQFKYITFPNMRKLFFMVLMLSVISSLNEFDLPYVISSGGSNGTATFLIYVFKTANISRKVGLASAMVVVLCIIIFTLLAFCWCVYSLIKKLKNRGGQFEK